MPERTIILVTGGAGHVGSHLAERLAERSQNHVISLDDYFNGSKNNHVDNVDYREGNTKDISECIPETPDLIYHLGEYARIAPSFGEIREVFDRNIVGTFAVLQFCRERGVGKLAYAASSTKFAERDEVEGRFQSPYAYTKAANVDLVKAYDRWYERPYAYAITYFFNVYGPREVGEGKYATVVEKFKQQYLRGERPTVVKPGTQVRGFTHVDDTVRGLMLVGEKGEGDGYQLGAGAELSILDFAKLFHPDPKMIDGDPGRTSSSLDVTKMNDLGWEPTIDIRQHIKEFTAANPRPASSE